MSRLNSRSYDDLRKVKINVDYLDNPHGSCLFEMGNTKVICSAFVQESVPLFLKNQQTGWVTAEYEMAPYAGKERNKRESVTGKRKGRSQEIQRLIGRVLRSAVDLKKLGERTIWIDCDVIQADGGTRTASVTGGFIALYRAVSKLVNKGQCKNPLKDFIAAVSVGIVNDEILLDLNYQEDFNASVDMNLAMTQDGRIIEIQGTAEGRPYEKDKLDKMIFLAHKGIKELIEKQKEVLSV